VRVARFPLTAERAAGKTPPPAEAGPVSSGKKAAGHRKWWPLDSAVASQSATEESEGDRVPVPEAQADGGPPDGGGGTAGAGGGREAREVVGSSSDLEELEGGEGLGPTAAALAADEAKKAQRRR